MHVLLHNRALYKNAVDFNNAVFCDVTSCGSCSNRRFGRTYRLDHQGHKTIVSISSQCLSAASYS
jgi:hypothetical protein